MRDVPADAAGDADAGPGAIALGATGLRYVYTGNVHDAEGGTTYCPGCGTPVVVRDWYADPPLPRSTDDGRCDACGTRLAGVYSGPCGSWGARRLPISLARR